MAFDVTLQFVKERKAFGQPIGTFQVSRFKMADMRAQIDAMQCFVDQCVVEHNAGRLEPGTQYHVDAVAVDMAGRKAKEQKTFHTDDLSLDQQTYPSIAPLQGQTVGGYLRSSATALGALTDPSAPASADTWALVSLTDYAPPGALAGLLEGSVVAQVYARVPIAGAHTQVVRIPV